MFLDVKAVCSDVKKKCSSLSRNGHFIQLRYVGCPNIPVYKNVSEDVCVDTRAQTYWCHAHMGSADAPSPPFQNCGSQLTVSTIPDCTTLKHVSRWGDQAFWNEREWN